ncbi:PIN domain-containing protein [Devosia sp.]|uniref:PIN domain-containing protein n=1 Tax=Devosia sp. TaxID=1871048 RepID=UPI0035B25DB0
MSADFLDTNVLVYFAEQHERKYPRSLELLEAGGVASVQVLNEFASVARRKLLLDWPEIEESLLLLRSLLDIRPIDIETHETGIELAAHHGLHVYDAMIVAAALLAGCDVLYSEDMQHGLLLEGRLRIVNPFA